MNITRYAFGLVVTGALLAIGHWLPWPRRLRRVESRMYSIAAIFAGLAVWLGFSETWFAIAGFAVVAGIVTVATYLYDRVMNWKQRAGLFRLEESIEPTRRPENS